MTTKINAIIATSNEDKLKELLLLRSSCGVVFETLKNWCSKRNLAYPDIPETGKTFEQNSLIKAMASFELTKLPSLSDDSGLVVPELNNKPGINSASYGISGLKKKSLSSEDIYFLNRKKLIKDLENKKNRAAYFICVITFVYNKDKIYSFEGKCSGKITYENNSKTGFGYDPIFICDKYNKLFSELTVEEKSEVSHRGVAMRNFFATFT